MRNSSENQAGLSEYMQWFRRRLPLIVLVMLSGILLAAVLAFALPPVYNAPVEFRISRASLPDASGNESYVDQYVTGLTRDVLSDANLAPIRDEFQLYPELASDPGRQLAALRDAVHVRMVTQKILDPSSGRDKQINAGFTVLYDAQTPEAAAGVTNALAKRMVEVGRRQRGEQAARNASVISDQSREYGERIAKLEQELADFKERNYAKLPDAANLNAAVMERAEQDLNEIEQQIRSVQQNRIFLQAQLNQARAAGPDLQSIAQLEDEYRRKAQSYDSSHPDMIALRRQIDALKSGRHAAGGSLKSQLETQRSVLTEARQRYSEDHPDVKRIQRNIQTLEARIAAGETSDSSVAVNNNSPAVIQLQTQLNAADAQAASLQMRGAELRNKLSGLESRMRSAPEVEREYQGLVRNLELEREKYSELLRREMDARGEQSASLAGGRDAFDQLNQASVPSSPAKPRRSLIVVLGVVVSAILAFGAALFAEMIDPAVRGTRDVLQLLGVTPLAVVPVIQNSRFHAQRARKLITTVVCLGIAAPLVYLTIWALAR